jgi:hypothetical protein
MKLPKNSILQPCFSFFSVFHHKARGRSQLIMQKGRLSSLIWQLPRFFSNLGI